MVDIPPPDQATWASISPTTLLGAIASIGAAIATGFYALLGKKTDSRAELARVDLEARQQLELSRAGERKDLVAYINELENRIKECGVELEYTKSNRDEGWDKGRAVYHDYANLVPVYNKLYQLFNRVLAKTLSIDNAKELLDQFDPIPLPIAKFEVYKRRSPDG